MSSSFLAIAWLASKCRLTLPILFLLLLSAIALRPEPARADNVEAANTAVDIFVNAGRAAGLPVTDTEATVIKQMVACGLNNTGIGDCARNMAVAAVVEQLGAGKDIAGAADCLAKGTPATTCLSQGLISVSQLPVEAQPMVSCLVSGQGNVADCTKKLAEGFIIDKVPSDFQPVAKCMIESGNAKKCGSDFVVNTIANKLPADVRDQAKAIASCIGSAASAASCAVSAVAPELKPLADCATSSNAGKCVADFAAQNLPAGTPGVAKDMLGCVGAGDFGKCAEQKGIATAADVAKSQLSKDQQAAIQKALDTIDKLRPDAPATLDPGPNKPATIKNIIMVAEGIRDKDWSKVVVGAGPELTKIASGILLSIFLSPELASILSPAVEAMINNDVEGAKKAFEALGKGNAVGLAQAIFEWYENSFIDKPCALAGDNKVRDTVCGGLSDAIKFISNAGGELAKKLLGAGQDVLEWIGVWGTVDDAATFIFNTVKDAIGALGHAIGIGGSDDKWKAPADCGAPWRETPADYFANHYIACLPKAAGLAANGANVDTSKLVADCNAYFNRCTDPKNRSSVAQACNAMSASLTNLAGQASDGVKAAAKFYADLGIGMASVADEAYRRWEAGSIADADDLCAADFWGDGKSQIGNAAFVNKCVGFVSGQFPLARQSTVACSIPTPRSDAAAGACAASLRNASAATKTSLAGPGSDYCKKQKQWLEEHHCSFETSQYVDPITGRKFDQIKNYKCEKTVVAKPPPWMSQPGVLPLPKGKTERPKISGKPDLLQPKPKPTSASAGGHGPAVPAPSRPLPGHVVRPLPKPGTVAARPPGRGSAMDAVGVIVTEGGMAGVAGNAGGPAVLAPRPYPTAQPHTTQAPRPTRPKPSGGGSNTASSGGGGKVGTSKGSKPASGWDPANGPIDYGGCSACGNREDPLVVK